jgi:hypothetical protein
MQMSLETIYSEIDDCDWILFKKDEVRAFFGESADSVDLCQINVLFDDVFALNAYLGRIEGYPSLGEIPYWEYSVCLEWCESHMLIGDSFELSLKNAKRFLGSIKQYYDYLIAKGTLTDCSELEKATMKICGGKKLNLVTDIPYTGDETYTELFIGGAGIRFDMADYWLLILKTLLYDEKWPKLLEAAMKISKGKLAKVKDLQGRMAKAGYGGLRDIAYNEVTEADVEKAKKWFAKP